VYRINPRWEGESDKRNQKRMFVRWMAGKNGSTRLSGPTPLEDPRDVPCPVGTRENPETRGLPLGQVAEMASGRRLLQYLAGDQYQPNGDPAGQRAKAAAKLLLESMPVEE